MSEQVYNAKDVNDTVAHAMALGKGVLENLSVLNGVLVVYLNGDLGAGKTTWVKAFGQALNVEDEVTSPTFNLVLHYEAPGCELHHVDAYRLTQAQALLSLGVEDWLETGHIVCIEWPERLQPGLDELLPADIVIDLSAETGELEARHIVSQAYTQAGERLLSCIDALQK